MIRPVQQWHGKCSTFGGPSDTGVSPTEGLALYGPGAVNQAPDGLFLQSQPPHTTGLARRLNPASLYCACRWDYKATGGVLPLRRMMVRVTSVHRSIWVHPCDWGPNERTGRVIDLSPGAARELGVKTDEVVTVELYADRDAVELEELT